MKIYKHYEGIYEVKNFITDEEVNQLFSFIDLNGDDGWLYHHIGNVLSIMKTEQDKNISKKLFKKIEDRANLYFSGQTECIGFQHIRRLKEGEFLPLHEDADYDSEKDKIIFGIVIYLNDDFEGGELYYADLNLKIKPIKNSLFIHKAEYKHEVLPIIKGNRYCITTFIRGNSNTKILIK